MSSIVVVVAVAVVRIWIMMMVLDVSWPMPRLIIYPRQFQHW